MNEPLELVLTPATLESVGGGNRHGGFPLRSPKIQAHHHERRAVVYVRQSSVQQVLEHRESAARQYALVHRAVELGWSSECVEVIDEDQGRSGATAEGRLGFQRLLAEVSLDRVGIILGLEMSRLARSCKDWHQLLELCAIFRTLLADQDGLYDPTDYNDRLLLGLKGTMSEAELHILQGRMYQGKLNKIRRGEVYTLPPIGYVKLPTGGFGIDPDEQVQSVVRLIFDEFERQGSVHGLLRYLLRHDIRIGVRSYRRDRYGQLEWRQPNRRTLTSLLRHEIYAGTYRFGHRTTDPRRKKPGRPGTGRTLVKPDAYLALLPGHCPAYITLERFRDIQERLDANRARAESLGVARDGPALLGGLVTCGRCGRRMMVHYSGPAGQLRYVCCRAAQDRLDPQCQGLAGRALDDLVAQKVLAVLEPAALELSLTAVDDWQREREQLAQQQRQSLERACYKSDRAARQYHAVEPENRLVARELERRWEEALHEQRQLEEEHSRANRTQSTELSAKDRELILSLARDMPDLWNASTTTSADRQRIVRCLLSRVIVNVQGNSNRVDATLQWEGGMSSQHELTRPVNRYEQMADFDRLLSRIKELRCSGWPLHRIAAQLNQEGYRPLKQAEKFHEDLVGRILLRRGLARPRQLNADGVLLHENEWWLRDLAKELSIPKKTLHGWLQRGWIRARKLPGLRGRHVCWADADELNRLRRLHKFRHGWWQPPPPGELTTPKTPRNQ